MVALKEFSLAGKRIGDLPTYKDIKADPAHLVGCSKLFKGDAKSTERTAMILTMYIDNFGNVREMISKTCTGKHGFIEHCFDEFRFMDEKTTWFEDRSYQLPVAEAISTVLTRIMENQECKTLRAGYLHSDQLIAMDNNGEFVNNRFKSKEYLDHIESLGAICTIGDEPAVIDNVEQNQVDIQLPKTTKADRKTPEYQFLDRMLTSLCGGKGDPNMQRSKDKYLHDLAWKIKNPTTQPAYHYLHLSPYQGNFKSTAMYLIQALLGPNNSERIKEVNSRFLGDSYPRIYTICSDLTSGKGKLGENIKQIVGDGQVTREKKYEHQTTSDCPTRFDIGCNSGAKGTSANPFLGVNPRRYIVLGATVDEGLVKFAVENGLFTTQPNQMQTSVLKMYMKMLGDAYNEELTTPSNSCEQAKSFSTLWAWELATTEQNKDAQGETWAEHFRGFMLEDVVFNHLDQFMPHEHEKSVPLWNAAMLHRWVAQRLYTDAEKHQYDIDIIKKLSARVILERILRMDWVLEGFIEEVDTGTSNVNFKITDREAFKNYFKRQREEQDEK